ncbi:uncharacterized protein [Henckelia pumila]|uniref:uncharacterized protein n=1 Tax=Henckelia pumila TaxID=405737 RepID=UPI003C6E2960
MKCRHKRNSYSMKYDLLNSMIRFRKNIDKPVSSTTHNALMEVKDLMLKEISLLNSISLQFQDAVSSVDGRGKLIHSLEGILRGTQQKPEKVELTVQSEEKICDSIKEKCTTTISELNSPETSSGRTCKKRETSGSD